MKRSSIAVVMPLGQRAVLATTPPREHRTLADDDGDPNDTDDVGIPDDTDICP